MRNGSRQDDLDLSEKQFMTLRWSVEEKQNSEGPF